MKTLTVLHRSAAAVLIAAVLAMGPVAHSEVAKVNSLRLDKRATESHYVIQQSGSAAYQEFLLNNPRRLVVDIVGARHALQSHQHSGDGHFVKSVRSSQFSNDPDEVTRIVFDLADDAHYRVSRTGNRVDIAFYGDSTGVAKHKDVMDAAAFDVAAYDAAPHVGNSQPTAKASSAPAMETVKAPTGKTPAKSAWNAKPVDVKQQAASWTAIDDSKNSSKPVQTAALKPAVPVRARTYPADLSAYTGMGTTPLAQNRMSMDVQGADIKTVLRSISEFSGANIVAGPEVSGPVTVHLKDVPWRKALDIVLKSNGYGVREDYGILRVQTLKRLRTDELDLAQLQQKKENLEPMISKVVELSFTSAKEMQQAMNKVTTKRGSISIEKGSNAVIVNDIPKVAERVAAMVEALDKKVSQVEITARLVDVDVEATREIGVQWDFMNIMSTNVNATASAKLGQALAEPFGNLKVGTVNSWGDVMGVVEALERENKANIISNPRITTANNREASILVGKEIPLIVNDEAGNPITELKKIGVTLRVTPHVNSDQTITLDLHPEISELASQATVQGGIIISLTEADTRVLVKDGETAVIGGLVQEVESTLRSGIPVLKDVPVLGGLFRFDSKTKKKRELVIFVTPKVVSFEGNEG